jgi:hypothetical protein
LGIVQAAESSSPDQQPSAAPVANHLIISALQTGSCTGNPCTSQPAGEFIELYNPLDVPITTTHWIVRYLPASGNSGSQKVLAELTGTIAAKHFVLISNVILNIENDFTFGTTDDSGKLADSGGHIEVLDGSGSMIDRLGWGSGAKLALGSYATKPNPGQQLQRHVNDTGLFINNQNNAQDFAIATGYLPRHGGFTATPEPTPEPTPSDNETTADDPQPATTCTGIIISEILPNPVGSDTGLEFIELHNPTDSPVSLAGCSLQVGSKSYALGSAIMAPDSYQALSDSITGITLPNGAGGTIYLSNASVDLLSVTYPADLDDDVSWAFANGTWSTTFTSTPNQPNIIASVEPCAQGQVRNTDTNRCVTTNSASSTTNTAAATSLAACSAGQERNPETNRCRNIASASASSLTPCKEGQERNPDTNRCRAATSTASSLQACPEGQERNPDTNRCRKVAASAAGSTNLNSIKDQTTASTKSAGKPYKLVIIMALGGVLAYGLYEWRQEICTTALRFWQKLRQTKPITSQAPLR